MPARDSIHDAVVNALVKDGWEVTDDPLILRYGERRVYVDLGAEEDQSFVGFDRNGVCIAVEIKSFIGASDITGLENAIGQFVLYNLILEEKDRQRLFYLAIPDSAYEEFFDEPVARLVIERLPLRLIVVDCVAEEIIRWVPHAIPTV